MESESLKMNSKVVNRLIENATTVIGNAGGGHTDITSIDPSVLVEATVKELLKLLNQNDSDFNTSKEFMIKQHFGMN